MLNRRRYHAGLPTIRHLVGGEARVSSGSMIGRRIVMKSLRYPAFLVLAVAVLLLGIHSFSLAQQFPCNTKACQECISFVRTVSGSSQCLCYSESTCTGLDIQPVWTPFKPAALPCQKKFPTKQIEAYDSPCTTFCKPPVYPAVAECQPMGNPIGYPSKWVCAYDS